ncbi:hypothetical protein TNCV_4534171 [Trichonephila clavipes]|nr:hypothetical protein TNCV_4534171 [Trichonephila clavipes]
MAEMDRAATSRTTAQQIQSVTHLSVYACTIRRRLPKSVMSARHPSLCLPLTGNHRCVETRGTHTFSTCHQPYSNTIRSYYTWHAMFKSSSLPVGLNWYSFEAELAQ